MESRLRVLFLALAIISLPGCAATKGLFGLGGDDGIDGPLAEDPGQVIDPEVERREIREPDIDTEDFEIGAYAGIMSIEDFESEVVYGVRMAYHVTEGFSSREQSDVPRPGLQVLSV